MGGRRWIVALLLGLIALGWWLSRPEEPKVWDIAVLMANPGKLNKVQGMIEGLRQFGMEEGRDYHLRYYDGQDRWERLRSHGEALAQDPPDLLITTGGIETEAVKGLLAPQKTPILFIGATSSAWNLVEDFRQPEGFVTGLDNYHTELSEKRLELLKKLLPSVSRVIVLYDPAVQPGNVGLKILEEVGPKLGIQLVKMPISSQRDLETASFGAEPGDAVLTLPSHLLESLMPQIHQLAKEARLPVMGVNPQEARDGFLAAYGCALEDQGYQAARQVVKILHGMPPSKIPVETPDRLRLVVNLQTARNLGLTLDPVALALAETVDEKGGKADE